MQQHTTPQAFTRTSLEAGCFHTSRATEHRPSSLQAYSCALTCRTHTDCCSRRRHHHRRWCLVHMKAYCINREQFDYVLDVTKFKTKAEWAEDPMKDVDTKTKSAFTRTFNKTVCVFVLYWGVGLVGVEAPACYWPAESSVSSGGVLGCDGVRCWHCLLAVL